MSRSRRWRFAFRITEGPNKGLGGGSWRVWSHGDDVYVAGAALANIVKVSLHASGRWRVAYTVEHMASDDPLWPRDADRAAWKFEAPPFVDGVQEAFVVAVARGAARPSDVDEREQVVSIEDRWDRLTGVQVVVTEPSVDVTPERLVFPQPLQLKNGRLVWLLSFYQDVPLQDPAPVPAAQAVRVLTPGRNDVSCPGYLLVGVNIQ